MQDVSKKSYIIFSLIVIAIVLLISSIMAAVTYSIVLEKSQKELQVSAKNVEQTLSSFFDEIQTLMLFVGKQIADSDSNDKQGIWRHMEDVLSRSRRLHYQLAWPSFSWVNSKDRLLIESNYGIVSPSFDLSHRQYIMESKKNPWILHFVDPPLTDIPANNLALLGGLGVTDEQGDYLGILNVSFDISELNQRIHQALENSAIHCVVCNKKWILISSSPLKNPMHLFETYFSPLAGKNLLTHRGEDLLNEENDPSLMMGYATKLSGYPYTVISYMQPQVFMGKFYKALIPHVLEIVGMGLLCLLLLYLLWRRIRIKNRVLQETKNKLEYAISLARESDNAKEEFLRSTNNELMIPLNTMACNVNILLRNLKKETDLELCLGKQITLLNDIMNHALDFKNLTNDTLDLKEVDLKQVIEECMVILSKAAFDKSISFSMNIDPDLPTLRGDIVKIKQIFVGLFTRSIRYSSQNQKIDIIGIREIKEKGSFVSVRVQDEGFGLSEEMIRSLEKNLQSVYDKDYMELDFSSIERLMKMHHGMFNAISSPGKGTLVTLYFPLFSPLKIENFQKKGNILQMPPIFD